MTAEPRFSARHFRAEREADWLRLEALLDLVEKKSPRRLSQDDLLELPRLYRATLSALSIARETSLDAGMIAYLESLSTRAYFILYGCREPWRRQVLAFFHSGWPRAVRGLWPEILVVLALTAASAIGAYALVIAEPAWFSAIIPPDLASGRNPSATAAALRQSLRGGGGESGLEIFATFLFTHNARVAILAFALGFAFGVPTLLLMAQNGAMLGAFYALYAPHGLAGSLTGWLMIHGTTELSAIILAGAAGLHIGRAVAFPGKASRLAAAATAGQRAAIVMIGVILMLLAAGLLEGFGRQLIVENGPRYAVAGAMLALWLGYFLLAGRRHG